MSKKITLFCDLCGEEIKNPVVDGYQLKIAIVQYPSVYRQNEDVKMIDAHDSCVRAILKAHRDRILGKADSPDHKEAPQHES